MTTNYFMPSTDSGKADLLESPFIYFAALCGIAGCEYC